MRDKRLLILGGTTDARSMAEALVDQFGDHLQLVYSLAGVTPSPKVPSGVELRQGGFGGPEGLHRFLQMEQIDWVVDATHPYAAQMAETAFSVCGRLGVPHVKLHRAGWQSCAQDRWVRAWDVAAAVAMVPEVARRAFLALGANEVDLFRPVAAHIAAARMITAVQDLPFPVVRDRGPFHVDQEIALFEKLMIDVVITKNSGGAASFAKIEAARALNLSVLMIERPPLPIGIRLLDKEAVAGWIHQQMA